MDQPRLRPLGVGEVLDIAINIVIRNASTLFKVVAAVVIPLQIVSVIVLSSTVAQPKLIGAGSGFGSTATERVSQSDISSSFAGVLSVGVISLLLIPLATAACFKAVSDAYLGERSDWRASLRFAWSRGRSIIWLAFLYILGLGVASLALIIPAVFLYTAWAVATPALLFEGCRGRKALRRSRRLVRGRWWPTFGALVVTAILTSIVGAILSAGVVALNFTGISDTVFGAATLNGISQAISRIVTTPITAAVVTVIYYDLRVRKEGFDLQLITERLGVAPAEGFVPRGAQRGASGPASPQPPQAPSDPPSTGSHEWLPPDGTAPE